MNSLPDYFDPIRLEKRQSLIDRGHDPYPYDYVRTHLINEVQQQTEKLIASKEICSLVGRIVAQRLHGKATFLDLEDETARIQLYFRQDDLDDVNWFIVSKMVDLGDLLEVKGFVFKTKMGELTLHVKALRILSKSLVPIPIGKTTEDKSYYQVSDPEIKYRERYIDWLTNPLSRKRITLRSNIIALIRQWMNSEGFLEVQTPTIEMIYGGAEARPFETSIWALGGQKAFLRISPELYLKRYIVGGFQKVYTICQNFRNEGIDKSHNPEFTMMEWYEAGTDYEFQMHRFETLVSFVVQQIYGSTTVTYQGEAINFSTPWKRITIEEGIKQAIGLRVSEVSEAVLSQKCLELGIEVPEKVSRGLLIMLLFEKYCEPKLVQPTFVLDYPVEVSPLTKAKRGQPGLVERFEPFVMRMELGNAYSELTDPLEQYQRFLQQREFDSTEGYEIHPIDLDFIKAIGCGMPPTGGVGLGVDRLVMLLTDSPSIRDIIPFPMMKPRIQEVITK